MKIAFVDITNFRKLKSCRIEFGAKETVFVGANNSGKTSAMHALILFLDKGHRRSIATTDFTLTNWGAINGIGQEWICADQNSTPNLELDKWLPYLPSLDIWLDVTDAELHHVVRLLPTLDWTPSQKLGVRLLFAPRSLEALYKKYIKAYKESRDVESSGKSGEGRSLLLWPESLRSFLDKASNLHSFFSVQAYILDPSQSTGAIAGETEAQPLLPGLVPLDLASIDGLLKIDIIPAQRGFGDQSTGDDSSDWSWGLSMQLRRYFEKHLDPTDSPDPSDIDALLAIEGARRVFDGRLEASFESAIDELQSMNYPGFGNPHISLFSKISTIDGLDHDAAVQFQISSPDEDDGVLVLPEKHNGLGYQNLISMVFKLIGFRDNWLHIGKARKKLEAEPAVIEPLHLVLIEEPEAHLHAQVQQVFIKKAYGVLRNRSELKSGPNGLSTQMVVSTHSSHIAHEVEFGCLRYFHRKQADGEACIPLASVVNLSEVFGDEDNTSKFARRYIKTTHCDLFFADVVILVEGAAERILLPSFIRNGFSTLDQSYVSILEIGGSHAHRLKPLLETLGIISLVITDLDSIEASGNAKARPEPHKGLRTGNTTLKDWLPNEENLDDLLSCDRAKKESSTRPIRVTYQCPIQVPGGSAKGSSEVIPYTFEDSLAWTNRELLSKCKKATGLLKKLKDAMGKDRVEDACQEMFESLKAGSKAEMALELLYVTDTTKLKPPGYIADGLRWIESKLAAGKQDCLVAKKAKVEHA